jgi:hypothetical protein
MNLSKWIRTHKLLVGDVDYVSEGAFIYDKHSIKSLIIEVANRMHDVKLNSGEVLKYKYFSDRKQVAIFDVNGKTATLALENGNLAMRLGNYFAYTTALNRKFSIIANTLVNKLNNDMK